MINGQNRGSGRKRGSGERSNWYSQSKFSNWTPFDPYWSEAKSTRHGKPSATVSRRDSEHSLPIYTRSIHEEFLLPATAEDVREILSKIPLEFLSGLDGVFLLGGSSKQAKALKLFHYGSYSRGSVYLHPFPKVLLVQHFTKPLDPARAQEYENAGAEIHHVDGAYEVRFSESSLRQFYLFDVLLHEIGHHIDARVFSRPSADAERFAKWFASAEAKRIKGDL
jgi:hypothetical protein